LTVLMVGGLYSDRLPSPARAVKGLGNEALVTVAVLFIVAEGLGQTGAMSMIVRPLLGMPRTNRQAQLRLMLPVCGLSAFLNNTPIVAMFMPVVSDWCKKTRLSPSRLFLPLSYAAILGGMCTLIGTSTNLVVYGMLDEATKPRVGMFTITAVGVPVVLVGVGMIVALSSWLLPDRTPPTPELQDPRRYTVEMMVEKGSGIDGKTIEQAGLRHLPNSFLVEIERNGESIVAVGPEQTLRGGDRLIFVGVVEAVVDLQKIRGLLPATNQVFKLREPRPERLLVEAVVSDACPIVGKTIREGRFRTLYDAAVIAVHRNGEQLIQKIGDIVLKPGDTLMLETHPNFVPRQRNKRDFFLVSAVQGSAPPRHDKAWFALAILGLMVLAASMEWIPMLAAALLASAAMVGTRCCSMEDARNSVDFRVLLAIAAAFGIGDSIASSGLDKAIAGSMIQMVGDHPIVLLATVYFVTSAFTEVITNNAAAVLVMPIAKAAAGDAGLDFLPFALSIMVAASASFATPIGYQTNLMVYGPGGYRFTDYLRIGIPLNLAVMAITIALVPVMWPLRVAG
jgi:di/tricarboxylate transporter